MSTHRDLVLRDSRRALALGAWVALGALIPQPAFPATQPASFLDGIHRQTTLTSTVPDNGDQNPYAIVVAPVSAGSFQKDDVLITNFNDAGNLQGLGTTIVNYNPTTKKLATFAALPARSCRMSRRRWPVDGAGGAQKRLGDRRQRAERRRHDRDQRRGLPHRARLQRQGRERDRQRQDRHAVGQYGGDR